MCEILDVGGVRIRLVGDIDMSTIDAVRAGLEKATPRTGDLTLDLSHLSFMGSEGLQLFIQIAEQRTETGRLVLLNPPRGVRRVLNITGIAHLPNLVIRDDSRDDSDKIALDAGPI